MVRILLGMCVGRNTHPRQHDPPIQTADNGLARKTRYHCILRIVEWPRHVVRALFSGRRKQREVHMQTRHPVTALSILLLAGSPTLASADVLNMGGTWNADGSWTGLASLETVSARQSLSFCSNYA